MTDGHQLSSELRDFTGSERIYAHSLARNFTYTEGVRHFAQNAGNRGAYWLLDILATEPAIRRHFDRDYFASVRLHVTGSTAQIIADDGNGNAFFARHIGFTDCPEFPPTTGAADEEKAWLFFISPNELGNGQHVLTMMLPRER